MPWSDRYMLGTLDDVHAGEAIVLTMMPGAESPDVSSTDDVATNGEAIASLRVDAGLLDGSQTS